MPLLHPNHQYPIASEKMETTSLAEELSAFRKKMERLRLDKEKTEKILKERDAVLHLQLKEMEERGQIQTHLEIQVDRLFRLKELKSYCMRISPLKSLRERQRGGWQWHINQVNSLEIKEDENPWQSSTPSNASQVRVNND
ncbi:hypothetical protein V6N12_061140 [Hibiscus sabdariffa]|uniref:Uncharacterized protein n=1 Tax=Hibiscus sabdariffa TaxID=183260 RepID=A0ABR2DW84_9ROSI